MHPDLVIGIPHTGSLSIYTFLSLIPIIRTYPKPVLFGAAAGCYVHKNRNEIVKQAQVNKAKWLLFVDTDVSFQPDALNKLLEQDKDIIAAPYNHKRLPIESTARMYDKEDKPLAHSYKATDKPFKVSAAATGFMLIKMSVFDKLKKPYFFFEYKDGDNFIGEDIYFCKMARKAGFDIWIDPRIPVRHYGDYAY